jgi:hypothetical protein
MTNYPQTVSLMLGNNQIYSTTVDQYNRNLNLYATDQIIASAYCSPNRDTTVNLMLGNNMLSSVVIQGWYCPDGGTSGGCPDCIANFAGPGCSTDVADPGCDPDICPDGFCPDSSCPDTSGASCLAVSSCPNVTCVYHSAPASGSQCPYT